MKVLATIAILPAGATLYFFVFWTWFDFWRRHPALTLTMMLGTFVGLGIAIAVTDIAFRYAVAMPLPARVAGWLVIAAVTVFGTIADRQIGFRVRTFMPFFDDAGRIELKTTGAYGIVRHPIYASGIGFQLGVFLVTGYLAILTSCLVFTLGAIWFTRQEERRLVQLLDDPTEYERYRARVGGLFPRVF
jgi:protein-S-isoprenylcysteine O-methyltransferase Ste14